MGLWFLLLDNCCHLELCRWLLMKRSIFVVGMKFNSML